MAFICEVRPGSTGNTARLHLRRGTARILVIAHWPQRADSPRLLVLAADPRAQGLSRQICELSQMVVLEVAPPSTSRVATTTDLLTVVAWAADHGTELGARPDLIHVAGIGAGHGPAVDTVKRAEAAGWPPAVLAKPNFPDA